MEDQKQSRTYRVAYGATRVLFWTLVVGGLAVSVGLAVVWGSM
jgi:hypothetical protein